MWWRIAIAWLACIVPAVAQDAVQRGAYLVHAGGCASCHTMPGGAPFAGGRALETPFGTFYSPNITPDAETGIGRWTDAQFQHALREGRRPDGASNEEDFIGMHLDSEPLPLTLDPLLFDTLHLRPVVDEFGGRVWAKGYLESSPCAASLRTFPAVAVQGNQETPAS